MRGDHGSAKALCVPQEAAELKIVACHISLAQSARPAKSDSKMRSNSQKSEKLHDQTFLASVFADSWWPEDVDVDEAEVKTSRIPALRHPCMPLDSPSSTSSVFHDRPHNNEHVRPATSK